LLAEKVVFAGIRGGHFLGREVAILLAEGWSLLAERVVFVGRMDVFSFKDIILLAEWMFFHSKTLFCWQKGWSFSSIFNTIRRHF
jgi:hypothetical protein